MWSGFLAIAYKEFLHFWRNKMLMRMFLFLQVIDFAMVGGLNLIVRDMPAVIVDQDRTVESRELVRRIAASGSFELRDATDSVDRARDELRGGRAQVAVVIPAGYARLRGGGGVAPVLTLVDGSDAVISTEAVSAISGIADRLNVEALAAAGEGTVSRITSHSSLLFNPQGTTSRFMLPALLALAMSGLLQFCVRLLVAERDGGHLERLLMTPINFTALILGKVSPFIVFAFVDGIAYLTAMRWVFGVPIRGSALLLGLALLLHALALMSLGMLVAAGARNRIEAELSMMLIVLATMFLSGYFFPLSTLPGWLRPVSYLLPGTHMVSVMRGLCLRGSTFLELLPHFAFLALAPIAFTFWSGKRFAATVIA